MPRARSPSRMLSNLVASPFFELCELSYCQPFGPLYLTHHTERPGCRNTQPIPASVEPAAVERAIESIFRKRPERPRRGAARDDENVRPIAIGADGPACEVRR